MKTFQIVQRNLKLLGMDPNPSARKLNAKTLGIFFLLGLAFASDCFFFKNEANSFREYMDSAYVGSAVLTSSTNFLLFIWKRDELYRFMHRFGCVINKRMRHATSNKIFEETNRRSEKWSGILMFVLMKIAPFVMIVPTFIVSLFSYFTTELKGDAFQFAVPLWFPFDTKQPLGFSVASIVQFLFTTCIFTITAVCVAVGLGTFLLAISLTKDIQNDFISINKNAKSKRKRAHALKQLSELIQYHSSAKQLTHDFSHVFQPIFMVIFTWSTITICISLLLIQIDLSQHAIDSAMQVLSYLYNAFGLVFVSCELCERVSDAFDQINVVINQELDWYKYSSDIKIILPMIIVNAQEPVIIECFGSISCNRMAFKQVTNSGFSYFMVLRQFYK